MGKHEPNHLPVENLRKHAKEESTEICLTRLFTMSVIKISFHHLCVFFLATTCDHRQAAG